MRTIAFAAPILGALALAACEEQTVVEAVAPDAAAPEAPSPAEPAMSLGGVDLAGDIRLTGTEPFWGVEMTGSEMVYSGVDRPEQRAPRPEPVIQGTMATWTTQTSGGPLVVTLMETECSDGMSDRTYPLTARVEIDGETLNGCAASSDWFANTGEDGQPREG